jgi:hypothetical protein
VFGPNGPGHGLVETRRYTRCLPREYETIR